VMPYCKLGQQTPDLDPEARNSNGCWGDPTAVLLFRPAWGVGCVYR